VVAEHRDHAGPSGMIAKLTNAIAPKKAGAIR
jgi:hypothetical protein